MDTLPLWALTVAYSAHIMEEYILDWKSWAEKTSGLKLEWIEFFVSNFAVIVLGFCCSIVGFECSYFSFLFVGLATSNAIFAHIGSTIIKRRFSPGVLTSVFLFLPLSTWAYYIAYKKALLTLNFFLFSFIGGTLIMAFPVILQLIKRKFISAP